MGHPLYGATGPRHGPAAASCGRQLLAIIIQRPVKSCPPPCIVRDLLAPAAGCTPGWASCPPRCAARRARRPRSYKSRTLSRLVLLPARDEAPQAAAGALGADEQVTRRSLEVVTADVAAEGRLATHAPEGRDAGHAVDRPGVLAAGSRDIGLLAVEVGQDPGA